MHEGSGARFPSGSHRNANQPPHVASRGFSDRRLAQTNGSPSLQASFTGNMAFRTEGTSTGEAYGQPSVPISPSSHSHRVTRLIGSNETRRDNSVGNRGWASPA